LRILHGAISDKTFSFEIIPVCSDSHTKPLGVNAELFIVEALDIYSYHCESLVTHLLLFLNII
jgi:hypothetical protein